ncbi:uncharacterized protein KY384_001733 [Bacidia gigantensis]|uniref:uncharacterized protein n=1 Tax=Bacidia gigantensis TaxID=2732470 RepID=UPI001D04B2F8|nr:uncharacterized protein KY384_001733 [Bacidia gigantensis]KAG8533990.1 hypothetical protein KY384_001733 [Bacidia gigantensis]
MPPKVLHTVQNQRLYDPKKSKTGKNKDGSAFDIGYGSGLHANGTVTIDEVTIGGVTVPQMPFGVAHLMEWGNHKSEKRFDGMLGLAFQTSNSIKPDAQCTFSQCLPDVIFTTNLKYTSDSSSWITLGSMDEAAHGLDTATTIPIVLNKDTGKATAWFADHVQFGSGGKVFSTKPSRVLFDTGGASMIVPPGVGNPIS